MEYQERDFLISLIRTGIFLEGNLKIIPATLEQIVESHHRYKKAYDEALNDQLMTTQEINSYMMMNGLWTDKEEQELNIIKLSIDNIKMEMYKNRRNKTSVEKDRKRVRATERNYSHHLNIKNSFYANSCEAFADSARVAFILRKTCYINNKPVSKNCDISTLLKFFNKSIYSDSVIRELARSEPWRSLWIANKHIKFKLLFQDQSQDLTINQRNIILWSTTYDNIQEAYEPPESSVIEDDDLLDGWFIFTKKKREKEKLEKSKEESRSKMGGGKGRVGKNGNMEEFIMINEESGWTANEIQQLNDPHEKDIINRRMQKLKTEKTLSYDQLPDVQQRGYQEAMSALSQRGRNK